MEKPARSALWKAMSAISSGSSARKKTSMQRLRSAGEISCGLRVVWIYTVFASAHSLLVLYLSYPVTWTVTFAAHMACFVFFYRRLCRPNAATLRD